MSEKINSKQKGDYVSDFQLVGGSEKGEVEYRSTEEISEEAKKRLQHGRRTLEAVRLFYGG